MPAIPKTNPKRTFILLGFVLFFCLAPIDGFAANSPPTTGKLYPFAGFSNANQALTFTATYSDPNGSKDIRNASFLINSSINGANCLYGYYDCKTNKLYLRDDSNKAWMGGYAPGSPGRYIENSYAKIDCSKTVISGSKTTLAIRWHIIFKPAFNGAKNSYLYAKDICGADSGWVKRGSWIIDTKPPAGSIKINNDAQYTNSKTVTLALSAQDDPSGSGLSQMQFSSDNAAWSAPEAYETSKTRELSGADGTKTAYVKFCDNAGNWSGAYRDTIILDTTPPAITITSPQNGALIDEDHVLLEGKVNGVPFSETRSINQPGQNTLTKTATDAAGNNASASVNVYLYLGQTIGPSGGEVSSSDGKVKIIIPQGALSENKQIKLLSVTTESLENAAPAGNSLLSVVECKPYGLTFNRPISIIYTLSQAEIPGTPVELGLYDSSRNRVIPTGQTSIVPADGYTLTFTIAHFSTYAALKNLTSQQEPIGAGVKIPLPDMLTGAFAHSIPITVAPGRKGMQPNIALTYRSSSPNSWTGVGFSLNPGYIVRSTRLGPPSYTDNDTFYFITDAGVTELVRLIDNLYQAKVESAFTKFFKEADDSWKVVGKDGSVLRLGTTPDSKETSPSGTFSWYITKANDTNGNYIEFSYTKDQGKVYPARIDYTGNENGIAPRNSVEFILESREDIPSSYISSAKVVTAKRLKEIQAKVNSGLVWRYVLEYSYSPDTNRSMLKSVTQSATDGTTLPQQKFTYQQAK